MQNNKLELLSPARTVKTGIYAFNCGADAVYIGCSKFGARKAAGNELADIEKLATYGHRFNAKTYVTINTILYEEELESAQRMVYDLWNAGIDAIIFQDMAFLEMDLPPIPLHASTQMHNHTLERIQFLENCGIKRVVLPRELSLEEVSRISKNSNVELEFFIHGALCVSYSGQCYFSQAITGRSANRGECAQPCRSLFTLKDSDGNDLLANKHLLSLKDLNHSENIPKLIHSGICSFKIEGRLKDDMYVKNITLHYRKILDGFILKNTEFQAASCGKFFPSFKPDTNKTFSRPYTTYFLLGKQREVASFHTQKSIGKNVGKVIHVNDKYLVIDALEEIHNGDGLCFFDIKNTLQGFKINRAEGNKLFPAEVPKIKSGTLLYRNYDHDFYKLLEKQDCERRVGVKMKLLQNDLKSALYIQDEDGNEIICPIPETFAAQKPERVVEILKQQLSKTGESIFYLQDYENMLVDIPFLTIAQINQLRRDIFLKLENIRSEKYQRAENEIIQYSQDYPDKILDFHGNVSNSLAEKFYKKHGINTPQPAFEISKPLEQPTIVTTKYCVRYELWLCNGNSKSSKLLIMEDRHHSYRLDFDCKQCIMKIILLK